MKKTAIILLLSALGISSAFSQSDENIVFTIDSLTEVWDKEALVLESYEGMKDYCRNRVHRERTIDLVRTIHHYDSVLYKVVTDKYDANEDKEAKATLDDIEKLEIDYATKAFLKFIHTECGVFNTIEKNYGSAKGKQYEKEVKKLEAELIKYVEAITLQIDTVDEHVHHLEALN